VRNQSHNLTKRTKKSSNLFSTVEKNKRENLHEKEESEANARTLLTPLPSALLPFHSSKPQFSAAKRRSRSHQNMIDIA
jgi:hypothetical protein